MPACSTCLGKAISSGSTEHPSVLLDVTQHETATVCYTHLTPSAHLDCTTTVGNTRAPFDTLVVFNVGVQKLFLVLLQKFALMLEELSHLQQLYVSHQRAGGNDRTGQPSSYWTGSRTETLTETGTTLGRPVSVVSATSHLAVITNCAAFHSHAR